MTKKERAEKVRELRERADRLDGKFNLYDYCANDIRDAWSDEAKRLRERADRLANAK